MIMTRDKKRARRRRKRRTTGRLRARRTLERNGTLTAPLLTPTTKDLLPWLLTNPHSSPNERHTCLMAKEKKVRIRDTPKYTSSSDEEYSDDEIDYTDLFKGLDRAKIDKINELIDTLNEKDKLLEKQEDILYEEHDKFVNVQKSLALETKRNEMLSSELSACRESITSLKSLNDELNAKLEEANETRSYVEHVIICNRCKDFDVDACNEHLTSIVQLNDEVASLNAQLKTCKVDFDKLKFARDAYTVGRHPSIKDGLDFRKEPKT
jgi:DNA repair exonuclease SbcCD ATPase subunit